MDIVSLVYVIANIFITFSISKFMKVFFEKKRSNKLLIRLSYVFYAMVTSIVFLMLNIPILNLICNALMLFVITLNYESSLRRKFSAVFIIYAFIFFADVLAITLTGTISVSAFEQFNNNTVSGIILVALIIYLESLLAQNFKNIKKHNPVSNVYWISSVSIPAFSMFITLLILSSSNISQTFMVLAIVIIFSINALTFYLHDSLSAAYARNLKSTLLEQEKEYYYNQCELMREYTEGVRSFKHDIQNHLSVAVGYIRSNMAEEAAGYLEELIDTVSTNTEYSNSGNTAFDSIINYKLHNAKKSGIEVQVVVTVPQRLNIEIIDTVTILGNLLDNAVNAVSKASEKKISLKIRYDRGRVFITVSNTFNGELRIENDKILPLNPSDEHGYGLKNVRKSVEKYNGLIDIDYTDTLFTVDVFLYASTF